MRSLKNQYLAALVVNVFVIGFGLNGGWTSPSILLLTSDDTPLPTGKITKEEISWIASLMTVGALFSSLIFGFVMDRFGRKWPLISMSIPMIVAWILVIFAQNVYYLYVARVLHGIVAGAIIIISPVFLTEIATDGIRGILGSTCILTVHFGVALAFIFGNYCSYETTPIFMITLSISFCVSFYFFEESPTFLVKRNKIAEAQKSIKFYRQLSEKDVQLELEKLRGAIDGDTNKHRKSSSMKWSDFTAKPGSKAMTIGIMLVVLNQFGGCFAVMQYTATLFEEAGSNLSSNTSAMIVAIIQFIGTIAVTSLVDRAGRRFLYVVSTFGAASGFISLGIYMWFKSSSHDMGSFNWILLVSLSVVIFFAAFAILTLPFTVIAEVMPENIKGVGVSFCMTLMATFGFMLLKFFPNLMDLLGFHVSMFMFAAICVSSAVFIILYVPETKGKSYEEIMELLH